MHLPTLNFTTLYSFYFELSSCSFNLPEQKLQIKLYMNNVFWEVFVLNYNSPHLITLRVEVGGWSWEVAFSVGPELQPKYFPKKPSLFSGCLRGLQNAQDPYILHSFDWAGESTDGWTPTPNCCIQSVHTKCFWFYTFIILLGLRVSLWNQPWHWFSSPSDTLQWYIYTVQSLKFASFHEWTT